MSREIVIVGAGFAGLAAARALDDRTGSVTVIDRGADFEFLPNIHEIISSRKAPKEVRLPRRKILGDLGHRFVEATVTAIDPAQRLVRTSDEELPYDVLILAAGGEATASDVPGAAEHAITFRSAGDAATIRNRLKELARTPGPSWVTIVGGGFTGVEVTGEILREYRNHERIRIRLVESGPRLLTGWPKHLHRRVVKIATRKRVEVHFGARVERVAEDQITMAGDELPSNLTIWTAGQRAPRFAVESGLVESATPWLPVEDSLRLVDHPEILIAGDLAAHHGRPAKQASQAIRMGLRAGKNAARIIERRRLNTFDVEEVPLLLTFGDLATFVVLEDGSVIENDSLAAGREIVFQRTMADIDRLSAKGSLGRLSRRTKALGSRDLLELLSVHRLLGSLARTRIRA